MICCHEHSSSWTNQPWNVHATQNPVLNTNYVCQKLDETFWGFWSCICWALCKIWMLLLNMSAIIEIFQYSITEDYTIIEHKSIVWSLLAEWVSRLLADWLSWSKYWASMGISVICISVRCIYSWHTMYEYLSGFQSWYVEGTGQVVRFIVSL